MASMKMKDGRKIVEMVGPGGRRCVTEDDVQRMLRKGFKVADDKQKDVKKQEDQKVPIQPAKATATATGPKK